MNSKTRLFADDCIIYKKIYSTQGCQQLQHDLHRLSQWDTTWGMALHPDKCNVLRVTRRKRPVGYSYPLKGHQLEEVTTAKYQGEPPMEGPHRPNSENGQLYAWISPKEPADQQHRYKSCSILLTSLAHIRLLCLCMDPT